MSAPFPCHSEPVHALAWESVSPCLPLRGTWQRVALTEGAISHGNSSPPVARADSPLPAGALQRGAAALTGRRTPRAFVPLRSTAGRRPLRAVQRTCPVGRLALRPPFTRRRFRLPCSGAKHPVTGWYRRHPELHSSGHDKTPRLSSRGFVLALPIFPGRLQPSIVSRSELNFRVRDGNGWTLALISTNYSLEGLHLQNRTTKEGIRKA